MSLPDIWPFQLYFNLNVKVSPAEYILFDADKYQGVASDNVSWEEKYMPFFNTVKYSLMGIFYLSYQ